MAKGKIDLYPEMKHYVLQHRLIDRGDRVLTAFSGGVDSTVLLHLLRRLSVEWSLNLEAAHIHHQLRGAEADADEVFCRQLCGEWRIPFHSARVQVRRHSREQKLSLEAAAREKRYSRLLDFAQERGCRRIALGHHAGDQAETVLQHLLRGSGISGLRGMPVRRALLVRPLLFASRGQIVRYAQAYKLPWREDSTNRHLDFQRNRIRLELLPLLQSVYNPQIERTLLRLAATMEEVHLYLQHQAEEALGACAYERDGEKIILEIVPFLLYFTILQKYIIRLALRHLDEDERMLDSDSWAAVWQYIHARQPRAPLRLCESVEFWRWGERLVICRRQTAPTATIAVKSVGRHRLAGGWRLEIKPVRTPLEQIRANRDERLAWIDAARLRLPLHLRPIEPGDRFRPLGMPDEVKVKRFLHDRQLANYLRSNLTVLESGGRIVWICGLRLDERFKVTENTKQIYRLKWSRDEV